MPAAYRSAAGDGTSNELVLLGMVERFGTEAVMGRGTLYSYEIRRMMLAEKIRTAYDAKEASDDWASWSRDNPAAALLLATAEKLAQEPELENA